MVNKAFGAGAPFGKRLAEKKSTNTRAEEEQERIIRATEENLRDFEEAGKNPPPVALGTQAQHNSAIEPSSARNEGGGEAPPADREKKAETLVARPQHVPASEPAARGTERAASRKKTAVEATEDEEDGEKCRLTPGGEKFQLEIPFSIKDGLSNGRTSMKRSHGIRTQLRDMLVIGAYTVIHMKPEEYKKAFEAAQKFVHEQER